MNDRPIIGIKLLAFASVLLLASGGSGVAKAESMVPGSDCGCHPGDRFDPKPKMPRGTYQGQCINSCQQRSVRRLSPAEAAEYGIPPQAIAVANVSHRDRFWVAQIPADGVETVIYQLEHPIFAAHAQLRFRFSPGSEVILIPQVPNSGESPTQISDLVLSVEAVPVVGGNFDLVAGFFDNFAIAYRLVSLEARAQRMIQVDGHRVEQIQLNLTPAQNHQLLLNAIAESERAGLSRMYHSFDRNCTSEVFRLLDRTTGYNPPANSDIEEIFINVPTGDQISMLIANGTLDPEEIAQFLADTLDETQLQFLQDHIPTISHNALKRRGLLGPTIADLNQELNAGQRLW